MRRSRFVFVSALAVTLSLAVAPATGVGRGGWDHVGHGSTASAPALSSKVLATNTDRPGSVYVGGAFLNAGGVGAADLIARWNGTAWSAVGGTSLASNLGAEVRAIAYHPATGKVYAGGTFQNAGGNATADFLAVWDGASWQPACTSPTRPAFTGNVDALQIVGNTLYVGGEFQDGAEIQTADYLLACDLTTTSSFSVLPVDGTFTGPIYALTADSQGTLYAGGNFGNLAQLQAADYVAAYSGGTWHSLGSGAGPTGGAVTGIVRSLAASGTKVYVGTDALDVAGIAQADHVARWDAAGLAWSALGANTAGTNGWFPTSSFIYALGASGSLVFAGGSFQDANGTATADMVAYFDGTTWRPIGSNGAGGGPLPAEVHALHVFGPDLYAGGNFTSAGGDTLARGLATFALRRQDALISKELSSGYAGNGIYNKSGAGQTRTLSIKKGTGQYFYVRVQNDGLLPASFKLKGTGDTSSIHAIYTRLGPTNQNITSAVKAGTYSTGQIDPGDYIRLAVRVKVESVAGSGTKFLVKVTSSGADPDAVKAVVTTFN